jgi:oligopeptidase B
MWHNRRCGFWKGAMNWRAIGLLTLVLPPCDRGGWPQSTMAEPVAKIVPHKLEKHGHTRTDNYYWLRERENPEVIAYLEAENRYLDAAMEAAKPLRQTLFEEFKTRIKQDDESVPYKKDGYYYYYTRMVAGQNYPVYCRKRGSLDAPEEVLLDANEEAAGHKFFQAANLSVSPDNRLLACATDTVGRQTYQIRFRDLETGADFPDVLEGSSASHAWANDNQTLFYVKRDPETLRAYQVYRHTLGTDPAQDRLIYEEADDTFRCHVTKAQIEEVPLHRFQSYAEHGIPPSGSGQAYR